MESSNNLATDVATAKGFGILRVETCTLIHAPQARVIAVYRDYTNWPKIFPTIKAVRLLCEEPNKITLEIDHREGLVANILTFISSEDIKLEEFKKKYDATFLNRFEAVSEGTRYTLIGDISIKPPYKVLAPFLKGYISKQMKKFVLEPVKTRAESVSHD